MALCAIALIGQAVKSSGIQRDICLSMGTGLITSSIVSLLFVFAGKTMRRIESMKQRESFLLDFKMILHSLITYLDFDKSLDSTLGYADFIKKQHRWFHEYYKKAFAKNVSLKETNLRKKQISDFFKTQSIWIKQCFEFDNRWKNSYLTQSEKSLLSNLYVSYKKTEVSMEQKSSTQAFYDFAFFLEWLSRLPDTFRELKHFKLISVSLEDNEIRFDYSEFYKKEKILAGIDSFHETRNKKYLENYGKQEK